MRLLFSMFFRERVDQSRVGRVDWRLLLPSPPRAYVACPFRLPSSSPSLMALFRFVSTPMFFRQVVDSSVFGCFFRLSASPASQVDP